MEIDIFANTKKAFRPLNSRPSIKDREVFIRLVNRLFTDLSNLKKNGNFCTINGMTILYHPKIVFISITIHEMPISVNIPTNIYSKTLQQDLLPQVRAH